MARNISFKDQNILAEIAVITKEIDKIYKKLFFEEVIKNTDTKTYYQLIEKLRSTKKIEQELYDRLEITPNKGNNLIGFLISTSPLSDKKDNNVLTAIGTATHEELLIHRILNKIENMSRQNSELFKEWLIEGGFFFEKDDADNYARTLKFTKALFEDFERAFSSFNSDNIQNSSSIVAKDLTTNIKYNLSFICENIENELLTNPSLIQKEICFSFPFIGDVNKVDVHFAAGLQRDYGVACCIDAIKNILCPNATKDDIFTINTKIFTPYLNASLALLFPLDEYDVIVNCLKQKIDKENNAHNNDLSVSANFIYNLFDNVGEVKPKCKYLHIIPRK